MHGWITRENIQTRYIIYDVHMMLKLMYLVHNL
jgi:hypothetical protein